MGHKIFISYKYGDTSVQHLSRNQFYEMTKVRDYVDEFQEKLSDTDHINKGEKDNESLEGFKNSTIASKLRDKIFDSTITVVFISPNMKELNAQEEDQWIPWGIAYSLRETTRKDRTSHRNAVLAVVLPDANGFYTYMLQPQNCCSETCTILNTGRLFRILSSNMFNQKEAVSNYCQSGCRIYRGFFSYIHMVRWTDFIKDINHYLSIAEKIRDNGENYNIHVNV